jgi:2-(3-amino-3-carboxypropyl)histidine synthase
MSNEKCPNEKCPNEKCCMTSPKAPSIDSQINSTVCSDLKCAQVATLSVDKKKKRRRNRRRNEVPESIKNDPKLLKASSVLPSNYNLEIPKTIHRIRERNAKLVGLQFPEGLLCYATVICDILEKFTDCETLILAEVTYGACCVDDLGAAAVGCDLLVHYGHSCLVPISHTTVEVMYVFVTIDIDLAHLIGCIQLSFPNKKTRLALMGTIQFTPTILKAAQVLQKKLGYATVTTPQAKPLSKTEVLGCTSPKLLDTDAFVFVADGRFHLESAMIHNPSVLSYQYNPYNKIITQEFYETPKMLVNRQNAITKAKDQTEWGIILGTLGRQGNVNILERLKKAMDDAGKKYFVLLLSEIFPSKLALFEEVGAWVQIACPRLSIDWGRAFEHAPLLNPYEAHVALEKTTFKATYPMDFYTRGSGPWTNYYTEEDKAN